jgi:DNA-binding LacI/PurR family transcriptional regulator
VNVGVSGVIIVPAISEKSQTEYLNLLKAHGIPFVFCNRSITGVKAPQVITNNFYGMSMIARHLIRLGYRKIGFISAMYYIAVEQRYQAYLTVLAEHGIPIREEYIYIGVAEQSIEENGYQGAKTLLQSEDRPEAIICFNDRVAIGACRAASELGLVIGKDIGITGYDDIKACEQIPVQLTTVRFPKYAVGKTAAELLHKMMMGEPVRQDKTIILQPEIVVRQSCGTQNAARK